MARNFCSQNIKQHLRFKSHITVELQMNAFFHHTFFFISGDGLQKWSAVSSKELFDIM